MLRVNDWDGKQIDVVIHGSFEEVAAKMLIRADAIVTSPPYGATSLLSVPRLVKGTEARRQERSYDKIEDDFSWDDYKKWVGLCNVLGRVTFWNVPWKMLGVEWGIQPFGHVIWHKQNSIPFSRSGVIYNHEFIFLFGDSEAIHKPVKSVWSMRPQYGSKHPAPFSPELPYRAITASTKPGDFVFDPFGGSGTTASTAKSMGRHWLTCDVSEKYCGWMDERLNETIAG